MNPIFTVIIPVYNAERHLKRCLDSVIHQSYMQLEIIIVNDGSTDKSGSICDSYAKKDLRIKVIHKQNEGVSKARNTALSIANGDYIHCVDADDYLEENTYLRIVEKLVVYNDDIDIIKFNALNSKNIIIGSVPFVSRVDSYDIEVISLQYIGSEKYGGLFILGVPWLYIIKRSLIEDNNIRFNENLHRCEDRLFIITLFFYAKTALFINLSLYHYETGNISLSNKYDKNRWEQEKLYLEELKKIYKKTKDDTFIENANNRIKNDTILRAVSSINNCFFSFNNNNFKENYYQVKKILEDPLLIDSFKNFRSEKLDIKSNITVKIMKMKCIFLLTVFNKILLYKNKLFS